MEDKLHNANDWDSCVSAQLPHPERDPELWRLVTELHLHGPCGADIAGQRDCRRPVDPVTGRQPPVCKKSFPAPLRDTTIENPNVGYPLYARPRLDDALKFSKLIRQNGQQVPYLMGNEWVVPYNPYLLRKFQCHLNVQVAANIGVVKYLFKYVYKGPDRAEIEETRPNLNPEAVPGAAQTARDEITDFLYGSYKGVHDALYTITGQDLYVRSPAVARLPVHLPTNNSWSSTRRMQTPRLRRWSRTTPEPVAS